MKTQIIIYIFER